MQNGEIGAIVLAGGKATRLGRNKAVEVIGGQTLIERVVRQLKTLSSNILIITSGKGNGIPHIPDVEIAADINPDDGPLGGIYTGLAASRCFHNIVVACDMPFLNTQLLSYMAGLSQDFDAVVPRLDNGYVEPLHAVYSKACLDSISPRLEQGQLRVDLFLKDVKVRYIEVEESRRLDPQQLSFFNINSQSDLDRAIAIADGLIGAV